MKKPPSVCVLASGGLDSDVLLVEAALKFSRVWPIFIVQGLRWEKVELYWLKRFLAEIHAINIAPLQIMSIPMNDVYGAHWSTGKKPVPGKRSRDQAVFLPGRNMVLSVKAAVFAAMNKVPLVAIGSLDHNPFPDASYHFYKKWGKALSTGLGRHLEVIAPFRNLSKTEVIQRGGWLPLHLSFSCLSPKGKKHCGRCNKCAERKRAFKAARVDDETSYA